MWCRLLVLGCALVSVMIDGAPMQSDRREGVDPDAYRSLCGIVQAKGPQYTCKLHNVTTDDGYILQTFRIASTTSFAAPSSKPVLLWHGLMDDAITWVVNMPAQSLAYLLADQGYDVWLGNSRGNRYALRHVHLNPSLDPFWQFTWDEMAKHDLPSTFAHIQNVTSHLRVGYVGHSQGTLQMFAALSAGFLDGRHVAFNVALAPVMVAAHCNPPVTIGLFQKGCALARALDKKAFSIPASLQPLLRGYCTLLPRLCTDEVELITGAASNVNQSRVAVIAAHDPGGTSSLNMMHWVQLTKAGRFGYYDYGVDNPSHYNGSKLAPLYNISNYPSAVVPTAILSGSVDALADPVDVQTLVRTLPPAPQTVIQEFSGLGHMDFVWNSNVTFAVYRPTVLPFVRQHMPLKNYSATDP